MTAEARAALRQLYNFRCGYCGVGETDVGAELTIDHFQPTSRGGQDIPTNWVYCCFACNNAKGNYWQPDSPQRLLHPVQDNLGEHIVDQGDGTLLGNERVKVSERLGGALRVSYGRGPAIENHGCSPPEWADFRYFLTSSHPGKQVCKKHVMHPDKPYAAGNLSRADGVLYDAHTRISN